MSPHPHLTPELGVTAHERFCVYRAGDDTLLVPKAAITVAGSGRLDRDLLDLLGVLGCRQFDDVDFEGFVLIDPDVEIPGPDADYLADLDKVAGELSTAADALVAIVARGIADNDSAVGQQADAALAIISRIAERVELAIDEPDCRPAGLIRGSR